MKWCTHVRITRMMPNGMVTGLKLIDMGPVEDDHDFGFRQERSLEYSPVTGQLLDVYHPVLHMEGRKLWPVGADGEMRGDREVNE